MINFNIILTKVYIIIFLYSDINLTTHCSYEFQMHKHFCETITVSIALLYTRIQHLHPYNLLLETTRRTLSPWLFWVACICNPWQLLLELRRKPEGVTLQLSVLEKSSCTGLPPTRKALGSSSHLYSRAEFSLDYTPSLLKAPMLIIATQAMLSTESNSALEMNMELHTPFCLM